MGLKRGKFGKVVGSDFFFTECNQRWKDVIKLNFAELLMSGC